MLWYRLVRCSSYYYYLGQWVSDKWHKLSMQSSLQETVGYAGRKLPAGVANDWVTRRSSKLYQQLEG